MNETAEAEVKEDCIHASDNLKVILFDLSKEMSYLHDPGQPRRQAPE